MRVVVRLSAQERLQGSSTALGAAASFFELAAHGVSTAYVSSHLRALGLGDDAYSLQSSVISDPTDAVATWRRQSGVSLPGTSAPPPAAAATTDSAFGAATTAMLLGGSAALLLVAVALAWRVCAAQARQRRALSAAKAPIVTADGSRREPARARIEDAPGPPQSGATAMMAWADPSAVGRDCRLPPNSALSGYFSPTRQLGPICGGATAHADDADASEGEADAIRREPPPPPRPVSPPLGAAALTAVTMQAQRAATTAEVATTSGDDAPHSHASPGMPGYKRPTRAKRFTTRAREAKEADADRSRRTQPELPLSARALLPSGLATRLPHSVAAAADGGVRRAREKPDLAPLSEANVARLAETAARAAHAARVAARAAAAAEADADGTSPARTRMRDATEGEGKRRPRHRRRPDAVPASSSALPPTPTMTTTHAQPHARRRQLHQKSRPPSARRRVSATANDADAAPSKEHGGLPPPERAPPPALAPPARPRIIQTRPRAPPRLALELDAAANGTESRQPRHVVASVPPSSESLSATVTVPKHEAAAEANATTAAAGCAPMAPPVTLSCRSTDDAAAATISSRISRALAAAAAKKDQASPEARAHGQYLRRYVAEMAEEARQRRRGEQAACGMQAITTQSIACNGAGCTAAGPCDATCTSTLQHAAARKPRVSEPGCRQFV